MIRNNLLMAIAATKGVENLMAQEGKDALRSSMLKVVQQVMEKMMQNHKVSNLFLTAFVMQ
ncbi:MAG: flagellar basal body-associated FliL family protein [Methylococcales bacterium]|nr:flagellar basal body-associated FliL family protein [Methylococcales bacterium]